MNPKTRNAIYGVLAAANAVLLVLVQQNVLPSNYAHYAALASFMCAAGMREFGAPPPADALPADAPPAPPAAP